MEHTVDLTELQKVAGHYVSQYNLLVAAGPVTAATLTKLFVTRNKLVNLAVVGGGVWFGVQELSGPALKLIADQFGYLQSIFSLFRG